MSNDWERDERATALSALLTGKALDVYSRLPDDTALDYEKVKEALLIRYQLTEEVFKKKYRESDLEEGETPLINFMPGLMGIYNVGLNFQKQRSLTKD